MLSGVERQPVVKYGKPVVINVCPEEGENQATGVGTPCRSRMAAPARAIRGWARPGDRDRWEAQWPVVVRKVRSTRSGDQTIP
jgi:hypothetical protein